MFSALARFASKYKVFVLAGWILITGLLGFTAPSLSEVGITDQSQFLPQATQSARVRELIDTKFAGAAESLPSSALIVVYNENGLNEQDTDRAMALRNWMLSDNGSAAVQTVVSVFDSEALRSTLVSADNTTMMMTAGLSAEGMDDAAKLAVRQIRDQFAVYPGTEFHLTGDVGFLQDLFNAAQETIDRTTWVTIILVIVLLLIIYRSPVASFVPLISIGCSFLVARGLIGFLAQAGVPVSTITDAFLVVTIFGVGTDYCLFIISRFREELAQGDRTKTTVSTMERIGPIILASAVTVIIAFLCLSISQFGMTRTSGWALAIGIAITLVAGATLVPALMSLFGRYLFWPSMKPRPPSAKPRRFGWAKTGELVARHPLWFAIPIIILLVLPYIAMPKFTLSANILTQLPKSTDSTQGLNIIKEHFPMGELSPMILLIESKDGSMLTEDSLNGIAQVAESLNGSNYISRVDYFSAPADGLISFGAQAHSAAGAVGPMMDRSSFAFLEPLGDYLRALPLQYPGITTSEAFSASTESLTQVSSLLRRLAGASPMDALGMLEELKTLLNGMGDALITLGDEFMLRGDSEFVQWLKMTYFSTDGTVTRLNLMGNIDPYSDAASFAVPDIRNQVGHAINASTITGVSYDLGGEIALYADMLQTSNDDFTIVIIVTSIGILAVIIILLRSLLAPLYMVATVLFNYGATLGITSWILQDIFGFENLINLLPVFVFVMLAAVGADYNIFLVSRIREEAETRPIKEAVQHAVAHTGNVITSCGIILAGTFATLIFTDFPMVLEIGTAISIGVLIDTFLVRALLVPALAVLFGRWSWWPSSLYRKAKKDGVNLPGGGNFPPSP